MNNNIQAYNIGVDLGGTNVRAGLVSDGKIIKLKSAKIPQNAQDKNEVLRVIFDTINDVFIPEVASIGIGVPGLIDRENQAIHNIVNIPTFSYIPLGKLATEHYCRPVKLDNDANCFALGEKNFGKGIGYRNIVGVTIGTGLGAGIISGEKLFDDTHRGSGEFGEVPYLDKNIEAYCSGQFFINKYKIRGEELLEKAKNGDDKAQLIFKEFGYHLSKAIKIIQLTLDPQCIIIGGSVAKSNEFFHNSMLEGLQDFVYKDTIKQLKIAYSTLQNAAILGAASMQEKTEIVFH